MGRAARSCSRRSRPPGPFFSGEVRILKPPTERSSRPTIGFNLHLLRLGVAF